MKDEEVVVLLLALISISVMVAATICGMKLQNIEYQLSELINLIKAIAE